MIRQRTAVVAMLCAVPVQAQIVAQRPEAGYAFDRPEVLAAQRVWGLAHGARVLALACAEAGQSDAAEAWVNWQEREMPNILASGAELSRHYFGMGQAAPAALSAAIGLAPALNLPAEQLLPACATLAEALSQPRYDLARRREEWLREH